MGDKESKSMDPVPLNLFAFNIVLAIETNEARLIDLTVAAVSMDDARACIMQWAKEDLEETIPVVFIKAVQLYGQWLPEEGVFMTNPTRARILNPDEEE